ncbi:MAG: hypothetical protein JOZ87_33590 [Chloroflexi bacterium]|nr:hypothetical protein [Chloroflexota bacterium]
MRVDIPRAFSTPKILFAAAASLALIASVVAPAVAQTTAQSSGWQGGPGAILDNTYQGFIDQPSNGATVPGSGSFVVGGWFVDTTAQGWAGADAMQVWLGTMDGGGKMLAQGIAGQYRPDVGKALGNPFYAYSGFSASVSGGSVPSGAQTLYVYMHTGGKGWWFKTVSVNGGGGGVNPTPPPSGGGAPVVTITAPTENQNVRASGSSTFTIAGTAKDPTTGAAGIDSVDVWINGERNSGSGTDLGQATLNGDGTWSLSFSPTKFPSTHTNIYVYAHSKTTGQTTEVLRGFNIQG